AVVDDPGALEARQAEAVDVRVAVEITREVVDRRGAALDARVGARPNHAVRHLRAWEARRVSEALPAGPDERIDVASERRLGHEPLGGRGVFTTRRDEEEQGDANRASHARNIQQIA